MVSSSLCGGEAETGLNLFAKSCKKEGGEAGCRIQVSWLLALTISPFAAKWCLGFQVGLLVP